MSELHVPYTAVDGPLARICVPLFFGGFAAWGVWFLYLLAVHPPSVMAGVVLGGIVLTAITWLFGWLAVRCAVVSWRSGRGGWWLRLSQNGFEVNDRIFRPRRHEWSAVEEFMLVASGAAPQVPQVGYRLVRRRRSPWRRLFANFRGRDGTLADGVVMGYWDRPFDEAVDLLNGWLARYKAA